MQISMKTRWKQQTLQLRLASSFAIVYLITTGGNYAKAQISSDGTLSTQVTTPDNLNFTLTDGNRVGSNLFHSFREFSVPTGGSAFFDNAVDVQNIISRVTGRSVSNIDGLLQANGTANLFLLNPNGIIFGLNAELNIGGSFVGSTARSLKFADGSEFSATADPTTPLLTISLPIGLQYGGTVGNILVQGSNLQVQPGNSLALVGGDVNLDGGTLIAQGGRVEVGGLADSGTIGLSVNGNNLGLSFGDGVARSNVSLTNEANIRTTAGGGGSIVINAQNLDVLEGSQLEAGIASGMGSAGIEAGDITLNVTDTITIGQSSGIQNDVSSESTGKGGNINIRARSLSLTDESSVSTRTFGQGDAGNISLQVNDTVSAADSSSIFSYSYEAIGNGGNIDIQTRQLSLTGGSDVLASTFATGNAGNIQVNASDSINISGVGPTRIDPDGYVDGGYSSGLFTSAEVQSPRGRGGNIEVTTNALQLSDGAVLSARTFNTESGGNITVNVNTLELTGGGQLLTTTYSSGRAGNITVNAADSVTLSGSDPTYFDRLAQFGRLVVDNDGPTSALSARSQGAGEAGNVTVTAGQLRVEDGAKIAVSGEQSGNAGNLEVTAGSIFLDKQGELIASTASGEGGNINLQADDLLLLRRNSKISTNAGGTGNGGNIDINSQFLVAVPIENSDLTANAVRGRGGNINITTQGIYGQNFRPRPTPLSDITASSDFGVNGVVQINTPDLDPSKGLATLPGELVDVSELVGSGCEVAANEESSQFVVTGRGGRPPNPNETLRPARVLVDLGTPSESQESALTSNSPYPRVRSTTDIQHPSSFSNRAAPLVEATGWVMDSKGEVILTDKAPTVTSHSSWLRTSSCEGR
jgi:filamentous hemagglutinin family protein